MGFVQDERNFVIPFDGGFHHTLGRRLLRFMKSFLEYITSSLPIYNSRAEINIRLQPNSFPHIGTLCSLTLTFVLANGLQNLGMNALVMCDLRDEAKGEQLEIDGITYQRNLRATGQLEKYLPKYERSLSNVGFQV